MSLNKVALGTDKAIHFNYSYDDNHRITSITDNVDALQNRAFTYDGLGRLATATGPWGVGGAQASGSFTYDSLGNLRKKILGSRVVDIQYLGNNRVNRARDTDDGSVWRDYTHDARGNVTDNDRLTFIYDRAEQPTVIGGAASGNFVYDGNLKRAKQVMGGDTVYSVYSIAGDILYRDNITSGEATDYIKVAGKTVARLKTDSGGTTVSYPHQDHLGSPVAATDAAGLVEWREDYNPFGEERQDDPANDNDENFTGHIRDEATGLLYMQARYMDPVPGRFLSGDPVEFSVDQPQMFNRYSYTLNDPINNTDPTGMVCLPCVGGAIGAGVGAVANTAAQFQRNGNSFENFNLGELGAATLTGAAFGATAGAAGAIGGVVGATSATVISGTGAITLEAINEQELTVDTVKDALVGEATGKGLGKAAKMLDDVPTEVTEAGVSVGDAAVTAATPADENVEIEQPDREDQ